MKLHLVLVLLSAILNQCALSAPFHEEWLLWKEQHNKVYSHGEEESKRHDIWLENKNYIEEHNQEAHVHGFTLKMNHLGDLVNISNYNINLKIVSFIRQVRNIVSHVMPLAIIHLMMIVSLCPIMLKCTLVLVTVIYLRKLTGGQRMLLLVLKTRLTIVQVHAMFNICTCLGSVW